MSNSPPEKSELTVITDREQISKSHNLFAARMTDSSDRAEDIELGFQGGKVPATVHWRSDLDLWMTFRKVETRYWTAFGVGNPFEGWKSIVVEINSPFEGLERRIGGVFLEDQSGAVYVGHRGRVGGGRRGIGQEAFMATVHPDSLIEFADGDKTSRAVLIGRLDADDLPERVASFVRSVRQFKADAVRESPVWWVNQGKTYRAERDGGFLWAPEETKSGSVAGHHKNVSLVQTSDVVLHYVDGGIGAIGQIEEPAIKSPRPDAPTDEPLRPDGWLSRVRYWELEKPIDLLEIPAEMRSQSQAGPFNRHNGVKQGYLFQLEDGVATAIRQAFADRWPVGSPWHVDSGKDSALHILLKWKQSLDVSTIDRHKSIADRFGSVWWGKFGQGKVAKRKIDRLLDQIENSVPTFAFLYRQGEVWKTKLLNATVESDDVSNDRIPSYYSKDDCSAFFEISGFETLAPTWPSEMLVLASKPDQPERMPGALGNQATPLFVYERSPMKTKPVTPPRSSDAPDMEWLVEKTLWPQERLEDLCLDIRTTSPQVVLAGPPGTSKTWVAKHVAKYLTAGNALATRTVQFHPSYGYEEFIQGLRPVIDEKLGGIRFDVVDGVVVKMANDIDDEDQIHVLVIDEMNRANLPRVFGELMYLFEYREQDEAIDLQYSSDFSLPSNLKFIGTMNTADRSIRSIDVALRRRFEVFECPPDRRVLERFYENGLGNNHVASLYDGFDKLNERLEAELDRHHTIGHTFFMAKDLTIGRLQKIWDRKLGPLIDEYFFDQPDIASEFSPVEFWPELESE